VTLEQQTAAIDLLLSDVILPGAMNGPALAAEVRRRYPDIKNAHMTGYAKEAFADDVKLDENIIIIQKSFKKAGLANTIRNVLDDGNSPL